MRQKKTLSFTLILVMFFIGMLSSAHADWFGLRDEPKLISVKGTLKNPNSIRVTIEINGSKKLLSKHQARAFLYLRSYIIFDDNKMRWHTTDKYKVWKKNHSNVQTPNQTRPNYTSPNRTNPNYIGPFYTKRNNKRTAGYSYTFHYGTRIVKSRVWRDKNGKRQGIETVYWKDGQISHIKTFVNNRPEGAYKTWLKDGNGKRYLRETGEIKNYGIVESKRKIYKRRL